MERKIYSIIDEAARTNLTQDEIKQLLGIDRQKFRNRGKFLELRVLLVTAMIIGFFGLVLSQSHFGQGISQFLEDEYCLVEHSLTSLEMSRPLTSCNMCQDLQSVPTMSSINQKDFRLKYAYTGVPLLVTNATANWTAFKVFDFKFLRKLYNMTMSDDIDELNEGCQFFPYRTNFKSLKEFFEMSEKRAGLHEDQWYVGWSNCNFKVMNIIRKHYKRPEFIPDDSESSELDWIFVGGHGKGAQMHIDYVGRPSWQAQISGKKTWTLVPPPECENVCRSLSVTVNKGDILAIDSNKWFHSTYIHPGDMSITIGSEYD